MPDITIPSEWLHEISDDLVSRRTAEWIFTSEKGNVLKAELKTTEKGIRVVEFTYNPED